MRATIAVCSVAVCVGSSSGSTWGFDPQTHAAMSSEAAAQSIFTRKALPSELGRRLGANSSMLSLGKDYIDLGAPISVRTFKTEEKDKFDAVRDLSGLEISGPDTIPGWMMRGSIREDDNPLETPWSDEPGGRFRRVFGHFFDPQNNRGLTAVAEIGPRAFEWGLTSGRTVDGRINNYKISDAREAMWRALTLTTPNGNGGFNNNVEPSGWNRGKEELRKAYWATTFRALGDVIHLVQDMAQPQHTRNDLHSGRGCVSGGCAGGHASFFEEYLRARTLRLVRFSLDEAFLPNSQPPPGSPRFTAHRELAYSGYAKPTFNSYIDFFTTGGDLLTGRGLAQYSSRGFYSFGTNIDSGSTLYPEPSPTGQGLGTVVLASPELKDMTGARIPGSVTFRTGTVPDTPGNSANGVLLSAHGLWDQFLQTRGHPPKYTLNYYNYDEQARLLVPRAVAYSAGLIDYFFRGKLSIHLPDDGVYAVVDHSTFNGTVAASGFNGFDKIRLKLKNDTPDMARPDGTAAPQTAGAGTLIAVMKFHRNTCYKDDLTGENGGTVFTISGCRSDEEEIVVSQPKSITSLSTSYGNLEDEHEFTFNQHLPINATDVFLQVVFRGVLGAEQDAIAVGTVDLSEPTYHSYINTTDSISIGNVAYRRDDVATTPNLLNAVQPRSCIDGEGRLKDSCLQPRTIFNLITVFSRPPISPETSAPFGKQIKVSTLLPRQLYRVAILTNGAFNQPIITAESCDGVPHPGAILTFSSQKDLNDLGALEDNFRPLTKLRGVYGWGQRNCVVSGDGQPLTNALDYSDLLLPIDPRPIRIDQ